MIRTILQLTARSVSLIVPCVAIHLVASPVLAQDPNRKFSYVRDAATGTTAADDLRAGNRYSFKITGMNPFCFTNSMQVEATKAPFDASAAQKFFATAPPPPVNQTAATPVPTAPGAPAADADRFAHADLTPEGRPKTAFELAGDASQILSRLDASRMQAEYIVAALKAAQNCASPTSVSPLFRAWQQYGEAVEQDMLNASIVLGSAMSAVTQARTRSGSSEAASLLDQLGTATEEVQKKLTPVISAYLAAAQTLRANADATVLTYESFPTERDDQSIVLTIVQKSHDGTRTDTMRVSIPLRRAFRIFFSTGIVASRVPSRHYDRTIRQAWGVPGPRETGTGAHGQAVAQDTVPLDSTFSTWAAVSGGQWGLVNPALFASVSLGQAFVDFHFTVGTTLRSVNAGSQALEPLIGVGIGLLDRLFLQVGGHYGRKEVLLIRRRNESAADVANRPIPQEIVRSGAVGTDWVFARYVGFSVRLD